MSNISKDSFVLILLCSNLGLDKSLGVKSLSLTQWNNLADKIKHTDIGRPRIFFETTMSQWQKELNLNKSNSERIEKLLSRSGSLGIELERLDSLGINITTRADSNYPLRLKNILKKEAPPVLFYSGNLNILDNESIGVVGSRNVDDKGLSFTKQLSKKCVKEGFTIVSGGAKGVDSVAQDIALESGGSVISVVSDSLEKKIKQKKVREAIMEDKLLMLSAVNPKTRFLVFNAMGRNKYIYALSKYTVAVSSDYDKGGTWAGASENLKNDWVPLFIRKEADIPNGNSKLIELGGNPLEREIIIDKNKSIREWFGKFDKKESVEETKQIDMTSIYNNSDNTDLENEKVSDIKEELEINKDSNELKNVDSFKIMWPYINEALKEPKNQNELCNIFNVRKGQMSDWINEALKNNRVEKLYKPVRYKSICD